MSKRAKKRSPKVSQSEPSFSRSREHDAIQEETEDTTLGCSIEIGDDQRSILSNDMLIYKNKRNSNRGPIRSSNSSAASIDSGTVHDNLLEIRNRRFSGSDIIRNQIQEPLMSYDERERYKCEMKEKIKSDEKSFRDELFICSRKGSSDKMDILLTIMEESTYLINDRLFVDETEDTLLHTALHYRQGAIAQLLLDHYPDMIFQTSGENGPTVLHVAVAMKDHQAVKLLFNRTDRLTREHIRSYMEKKDNFDIRHEKTKHLLRSCSEVHSLVETLLHQQVRGDDYANTCMEGELPLTIAAWNTDEKMCHLLIENGAKLKEKNSKGDSVFHEIVKLSVQPEATDKDNQTRLNNLITLFHFLIEEAECSINDKCETDTDFETSRSQLLSELFSIKNNENYTPLALAAKLGAPHIYSLIINLRRVYRFLHATNGVCDVFFYDVTDIDTCTSTESGKSILECIPDNRDPSTAFTFVEMMPIKQVINFKWLKYAKIFYAWMFVHFILMIALTTVAIYRPVFFNVSSTELLTSFMDYQPGSQEIQTFINSYSNAGDYVRLVIEIIILIYAGIILVLEFADIIKTRTLPFSTHILHNEQYRLVIIIFASGIICSFVLRLAVYRYEHISMIISLITGWWFLLFFTRGFRKFSYFTVLINKVVFGDLLRFSILIIILLVSFSSAMYLTFKSSQVMPKEFRTFWDSMFTLFKLALGLAEINVLDNSPFPELSTILFIVFVVLAYVLAVNMLIAMVSETCATVAKTKITQWKLQKLTIILFLEKRLPKIWRVKVGSKKLAETFRKPNLLTNAKNILKGGLRSNNEQHSSKGSRYFYKVKTNTTHYDTANSLRSSQSYKSEKFGRNKAYEIDMKNIMLSTMRNGGTFPLGSGHSYRENKKRRLDRGAREASNLESSRSYNEESRRTSTPRPVEKRDSQVKLEIGD